MNWQVYLAVQIVVQVCVHFAILVTWVLLKFLK